MTRRTPAAYTADLTGVSLDIVTAFSTPNDTIPTKLRESTLSQRGAARAAPCSIVGNGQARRKAATWRHVRLGQRIRDKLPAGEVTLEGPFVHAHRAELVHLVRNEAEHEREEHPLHRIMQLDEGADRVRVATTDIHLPQRIGEALKRAYDGELELHYGHDEYTVRVHWRR